MNNGPEAELISRHMVSRRGLLAGSVTLLAAAFVFWIPAFAQTPLADEHYGYLDAVIETLSWAQTALSREQAVSPHDPRGATEILIAYSTASKLAASDYATAARRLEPYVKSNDDGIRKGARTLIDVYRALEHTEKKTYEARLEILRGNADTGEMRVRAAELRSTRQGIQENLLLSMKLVVFAFYDMTPGGDPNARLRMAITESHRQELLQKMRRMFGQRVAGGPKEDQEVPVAAAGFLFQELTKVKGTTN